MAREKDFSFHYSMNIVKYMVACIVKKHTNHRERRNVYTEIMHETIYAAGPIEIFKTSQRNQFVSLFS